MHHNYNSLRRTSAVVYLATRMVAMAADLYTSGEYLRKNPTWHADEAPWKAQQILRLLEFQHLAPQTICEVGCGTGEILRLLQKALPEDCILYGYEISP